MKRPKRERLLWREMKRETRGRGNWRLLRLMTVRWTRRKAA